MRAAPIFCLSALCLIPELAFSQTAPTVTLVQQQPQTLRLTREEIEDNADLRLSWTFMAGTLGDNNTGNPGNYYAEYTLNGTNTHLDMSTPLVALPDDQDNPLERWPINSQVNGLPAGTSIQVLVRPQNLVPANALTEGAEGRADFYVRVYDFNNQSLERTYANQAWNFEYDTLAPTAPQLVELKAGDKSVTPTWRDISGASDVASFKVKYCPKVSDEDIQNYAVDTSTLSGTIALRELPCSGDARKSTDAIGKDAVSSAVSGEMENGTWVAVAVTILDEFGNESAPGNVLAVRPVNLTDFFELYRQNGGSEQGGFCFIATAAFGSYAHPVVQVLRLFRDSVLNEFAWGRDFVQTYYQLSPKYSRWLRAHPSAAHLVRPVLIIAAGLALMLMNLPWVIACAAIVLLGFRFFRRTSAVAALALILLASSSAQANQREKPEGAFGMTFELRGGPSLPNIARTAADGGDSSFRQIYDRTFYTPGYSGTDQGQTDLTKPLYTIATEFQLYRGVWGTAGIGGSFSFMQWVGRSRDRDNNPVTAATAVFNVVPLTLVGTYRFDWLLDHTVVPFAPYIRAGLAYYLWWETSNDGGITEFQNGSETQQALGGKLGLTGTIGISFLLNSLERDAARNLFHSTGIRGSYVFFEGQASQVDGFGSGGFDFSDVTWNAGVLFEF